MKTAIIVAFACCFALALAEVGNTCKGGDECEEDECCMKISLFTPGKCRKLKQKDQLCFPREDWNKEENTYRFMCPCVEGLVCKPAEVKEKDGVTVFKDAKCVEPDSTVF